MSVRELRQLTAIMVLPLMLALVPGPAAGATVPLSASPCFPSEDNGDPVLTSLHIAPTALDATRRPATVRFTATAYDTGGPGAPSGVRQVTVYIGYEPDGNYSATAILLPGPDGTFEGAVTVKTGYRTGLRYILGVDVTDTADNTKAYFGDTLNRLPDVDRTYRVATSPDTRPPKLVALSVSPTVLDSRQHTRTVHVSAHVRDDVAVARVIVGFSHLPYAGGPRKTHLHLSSGTVREGTWTGRLQIGRWQTTAPRRLWVNMKDTIANISVLRGNGLTRRGQPSMLQVRSGIDRRAPTVHVVSVTPGPLDVSAGPVTLTVLARARDAASGVTAVNGTLQGPGGTGVEVTLRKASGDGHDGRWRGTVTLHPCQTPPGRWALSLNATDLAGNIASAKPTPTRTVTGRDVTPPLATLAAPVALAGPLVVSFDEDVRGVSAATATAHASAEREASDTNSAAGALPGTWACIDGGGTGVSCETGPVRKASFTPSVPFTANGTYWLVLNPEHELALTDMAGNPYIGFALDFYPT